jgi:RNA polymerase sigma factor (sigma-70 family)
MATAAICTVLHHLRKAVLTGKGGDLTDAQLLDCYLTGHEEAAFEALVRRHGPMVLGVCRRVLGNAHDAEDAFQATFLVLVRKAATIRPRERVGHWLHGVAYRTALKARHAAARRQAREATMSRQEAVPPSQPNDWLAVLDQELQRLPEKYRAALVLCDLEGKTRKEAARQLGWAEGTLSTRLTRARAMLVERLSRRGVTISALALTAALAEHSAAAFLPASLLTATVQVQRLIGLASAAGAIPTTIAALMEGVMKSMAMVKTKKLLAIALIALSMIGFGVGGYSHLPAEEPGVPEPGVPDYLPPTKAPAAATAAKALPVPSGPVLTPALVSLSSHGDIIIKRAVHYYEPVNEPGMPPGYRDTTSVVQRIYERRAVCVFDSQGRKVEPKKLARLLKKEVAALIVHGPDQPDPVSFQLLKEGTLVVQVPVLAALPAAPAVVPAPTTPVAPTSVPVPTARPLNALPPPAGSSPQSAPTLVYPAVPEPVAPQPAPQYYSPMTAPVPPPALLKEQVIFCAKESASAGYAAVFDEVKKILGEHFEVFDANRFDGRIQAKSRPEDPSVSANKRDIRRRASARIDVLDALDALNFRCFTVWVQIHKEQRQGGTGEEETTWKPLGRDTDLEQLILRRLAECANRMNSPSVPVDAPRQILPPRSPSTTPAAPREAERMEPPRPSAPKRPAPIVIHIEHFEIAGNTAHAVRDEKINPRCFKLSGDVEASYAPSDRPSIERDRSRPAKNGFFLRCDTVMFDTESSGACLRGEGKVALRVENCFAKAGVLKYYEAGGIIILEASKGIPARLYQCQQPYPSEIRANRIVYCLSTGEIKVEGAEALQSVEVPAIPLGTTAKRIAEDQAAKDFQVAEFYRRTGHPGSARFYYELICRRYPNSSRAQAALGELRKLKAESPPDRPVRIGEVIIRGNEKVAEATIRAKVHLHPGQLLRYEDLRLAEKKLAESGLFNVDPDRGIPPTVTVIESNSEYKDVLITVQEK